MSKDLNGFVNYYYKLQEYKNKQANSILIIRKSLNSQYETNYFYSIHLSHLSFRLFYNDT